MKQPLIRASAFLLLTFFSLLAWAEAPEQMLKNTTQRMLDVMEKESDRLKHDPDYLIQIVETILVPHVDTTDMARWVVGPTAWNAATHEEQREFTEEFKRLVIKTYSSTFNAYHNQTIEYLPIRGDFPNKPRVQVQSLIKDPRNDTVKVAYRLVKTGNSWRVYDIIIEGVSILKGFKSQFAKDIRTGGVKQITETLKHHNNKPAKR